MFSKLVFVVAMILGLLWATLDTWVFHGHQSDSALSSDTTATLHAQQLLQGNDSIELDVDRHWVTLRGKVDTAEAKASIGAAVAHQLGVRGVTNNIEVLNVGALTGLRTMLSGAPHNMTFGYEVGRNGAITLTGVLPTEQARGPIVDMVYAVSGVQNVIDNMTVAAPRVAAAPAQGAERRIADILRLHKIYFASNKATLRPASDVALDAITQVLREFPDSAVQIEGHTDSVGADSFNMDLSRRRASAVRDALVSRGIVAGRLVPEGFGETRPTASNDSNEGRAENRRIEFRVAG